MLNVTERSRSHNIQAYKCRLGGQTGRMTSLDRERKMSIHGRPPGVTWDYDRVELIVDGVIHAIGVTLGVVGAIVIGIVATNSSHTADDMAHIVIYVIGFLFMLGFSAAYNTWPICRVKCFLRGFHPSAIYVMIDGTYAVFIEQINGNM